MSLNDVDPLTPQKVVERIAFVGNAGQHQSDANVSSIRRVASGRLEPSVPPPDYTPPAPPSAANEEHPPSYQHETLSASDISITNYHEETPSRRGLFRKSSSTMRASLGDVSVRPNTGNTNSADGDSLAEVLWKLRLVNLVASSIAILLEIPNFLGNMLTLHPARAVLGMYLAFFALLLVCFELHTPMVEAQIKSNFGLLHHPLGRSFVLFLMGGLAIGQANAIDIFLGLVFIFNGILTTYAFIRYPEWRQRVADEEQHDANLVAMARDRLESKYAWASPQMEVKTAEEAGDDDQRASLLRSISSNISSHLGP